MNARRLTLSVLATVLGVLALTAVSASAFSTRGRILRSAPFSQPSAFSDPTGVAVDQETGNVYVANNGADAVDVFGAEGGSPAGGVPKEITGLDGLAISSSLPQAVAVDNACYFQHKSGSECQAFDPSNGDVYVAEEPKGAIAKFKLNALGTEYELAETLHVQGYPYPMGVAVDTEGNVYVVNLTQTIAEFNSAGVEIGDINTDPYQGVQAYVAVGTPGVVYVGRYRGGVVKVEVNAKDEVEHEEDLGGAGGRAVAVDSHGNVYIDEVSSVSGYNSSGALFEEFGSGVLEGSEGVAVNDETENPYVSNRDSGNLAVFGPSVIGPVIDGESASAVASTSATLEAQVNPNRQETHGYFQYATTSTVNGSGSLTGAAQIPTPPGTDLGEASGDQPLGPTALAGLTAGTTYYYQAIATNAAETAYGAVQSFTTVPTPKTEPVSSIGGTTATFNGTLTPLNSTVATEYFFYYDLGEEPVCTNEHETLPHESAGTGAGGRAVSTPVTELEPSAHYTVCLVSTNAFGSEEDSTPVHFETQPVPPTVVTEPATYVGTSGAMLNATVNPNKESTTYIFEYSTEATGEVLQGTIVKVPAVPGVLPAEFRAQGVSEFIGGLTPHTTYYYRVVAENAQSEKEGRPAEGKVEHFGTGPLEVPEKLEAKPVGVTEATLHGVLNPNHAGSPGSSYEFLYQVSATGCEGGGSSGGSALGDEKEAVQARVTGLLANTTYTFCLRAKNEVEEELLSAPVTFTTSTEPPAIERESVSEVGSSSVRLNATVNPNRDPSTYFFEYGTSAVYGSATPVGSVGGGSEGVGVFAQLSELEPGVEYHFRVVAKNASGETVLGGDQTFKTSVSYVYPPGVVGLPDGRGYELVSASALENENANVYTGLRNYLYGFDEATEGPMQVSADGSAVRYMGEPSAGGNGNLAPSGNSYLATRSAGGGWVARNITLTGLPPGYAAAFSSALANAGTSSVPAFSHVLRSEPGGLVDETGGRLVAVSVLPDGEAAPEATFGTPEVGGANGTTALEPDFSGVISADGSRVFWTDLDGTVTPEDPTGVTRLFVREDDASADARTVQVDASALPGTEREKAEKGGGGLFWTASSDGSKVYFTDEKQLTEDSTAAPGAPDLYVYDVETGQLTDLTVDATPGEHADVQGVLGAGESQEGGAYVYFVAYGDNLYVLHEGEQPKLITGLSGLDDEMRDTRQAYYSRVGDWAPSLGQRTAEVTPDGRHLAFLEPYRASYYGRVLVYDAPAGSLSCASCDPNGGPSGGRVATSSGANPLFMPQFISDDGSRVFFESNEQLTQKALPNGEIGVYEWEQDGTGSCQLDGGCIYLLSSGVFLGASANGNDVFVITKEDLVPQNQKSEDIFVYDIRVGAPPPLAAPACTSTGCQGAPAAAPVFATPASATFEGVGNFPPPPAVVKPPAKKKVAKCPRGKTHGKRGKCVRKARSKKKAKAKKTGDKRRTNS
jgi:hypothetical protein